MKLIYFKRFCIFIFFTSLIFSSCSEDNIWDNCTIQVGEAMECIAPQDVRVEKIECNSYRLTLVGDGEFGTTLWKNENTSPSDIQTETGSLVVTIPNQEALSKISGQTQCCKADKSAIFDFHFTEVQSRSILPSPKWIDAPPTFGFQNDVLVLTLSNPPLLTDDFKVEWSSSEGTSIQGDGSTARIKLDSLGAHWIRVTYIKECTQEEEFIEEGILVI